MQASCGAGWAQLATRSRLLDFGGTGAELHLWRVAVGEQLIEIDRAPLDLESRLQDWLVRERSPRRRLTTPPGCQCFFGLNDHVTAIANDYLAGAFESAFRTKLGVELPEPVNGDHRFVVGSEIDSSSERIMRYLSDTHGVNVNAATFHYFQPADGPELLARVSLLEPSEVEPNTRAKGSSKASSESELRGTEGARRSGRRTGVVRVRCGRPRGRAPEVRLRRFRRLHHGPRRDRSPCRRAEPARRPEVEDRPERFHRLRLRAGSES